MSRMLDFLYDWCGKRRIKLQFDVESTGSNDNLKYSCKLRIGDYDFVGVGNSSNRKDAEEDAAKEFVDYLRKHNIITSKEIPRTEPFGGPLPNISTHRIWSRGVLVLGALAVVYFSSAKDKMGREKPFALTTENIHHRSQEVSCSEDYKQELKLYNHGCIPRRCGRFVSDSMLSKIESDTLLVLAMKGFALDWRLNKAGSFGAATILDLYSGALTSRRKPGEFIDARRFPGAKELFGTYGIKVFRDLKNRMREAIRLHFGLGADAGGSPYLTHPTFFSRLTAEEPLALHDQYWLSHVDKESYESFHYTGLIYLNDYKRDFTGGRFIYTDTDSSPMNRTVEPKKGRISIFTSGSENRHQVERVKSGVRYALTISFTCNEAAAIPDISPAFIKKEH